MKFIPMLALYLLIGLGLGVAVLVRKNHPLSDALLMWVAWPLLAPLWFLSPPSQSTKGEEKTSGLDDDIQTRASQSIERASARCKAIDALLARPDFQADAIEARVANLKAAGEHRAAQLAARRLAQLEHLIRLRAGYNAQLEEVKELMAQLEIQNEMVRIAGGDAGDARDLASTLLVQIESLDDVLSLEAELQHL